MLEQMVAGSVAVKQSKIPESADLGDLEDPGTGMFSAALQQLHEITGVLE